VRELIRRGVASEEGEPALAGAGRVCRIFARPLYRALGAEHVRHRRGASPEVLLRRLISLDYVIERPELPWLPTEAEKVAAFRALGIPRALLPSRLYRSRSGSAATRRHFPVKLPIALDARNALFLYAEPGHGTAAALRSWGARHRPLWRALSERGIAVEVVVAGRTRAETKRAERVVDRWMEGGGEEEGELERIRSAIRRGTADVLGEYGGLQGAMQRSASLAGRLRGRPGTGCVQGAHVWRSARLAGTSRP